MTLGSCSISFSLGYLKVDRCHHVLTNPYSCRLYNKDAVIEFLLDKSAEKALGKAASHIKSIKVRCGMSVPQER
jgi:hypothetical protein